MGNKTVGWELTSSSSTSSTTTTTPTTTTTTTTRCLIRFRRVGRGNQVGWVGTLWQMWDGGSQIPKVARAGKNEGRFLSYEKFGLNFWKVPVSNGTAHSGISKKEETSWGKHKFFDNVLSAIFSSFEFSPGISRAFSWIVRFWKIQEFPVFWKLSQWKAPRELEKFNNGYYLAGEKAPLGSDHQRGARNQGYWLLLRCEKFTPLRPSLLSVLCILIQTRDGQLNCPSWCLHMSKY